MNWTPDKYEYASTIQGLRHVWVGVVGAEVGEGVGTGVGEGVRSDCVDGGIVVSRHYVGFWTRRQTLVCGIFEYQRIRLVFGMTHTPIEYSDQLNVR